MVASVPELLKADEVGAEARPDLLRQRDPVLGRKRVAGPVRHAPLQGLCQQRVGVSRGEDAEGHVEVDVLVAVGVPDPRATTIGHEQRVGIVRLKRAGDAQRQGLRGPRVQLRAAPCPLAVGGFLAPPDLADPIAVELATLDDGHCMPPTWYPSDSSP
jgi:hypothetical protein